MRTIAIDGDAEFFARGWSAALAEAVGGNVVASAEAAPDLIVVRPQHAARFLDTSRTPFAVVNGDGPHSFRDVLVAVDDSAGGRAAVSFCHWFASSVGSRIVAVFAKRSPSEVAPRLDAAGWRGRAMADLERRTHVLRASEDVTLLVEHEDPVTAILNAADDMKPDLVIVGAEPLTRVPDARRQGFVLAVVDRIRVPAIVVPAEASIPSIIVRGPRDHT